MATASKASGPEANPAARREGQAPSQLPQTSHQASGALWQRVIELADTRQLRALLGQAELAAIDARSARIRAAAAAAPMIEARRAAVESLLAKAAGRPVTLEIEPPPDPGEPAGPAPETPAASGEEHPLVRRAAELFGAKVVHVEPLRRPQ